MTTSKICPRCGIEKPLNKENFYFKDSGKPNSYCRPCFKLYNQNTKGVKARQNPVEARAENILNKQGIPTDKHNTNSWDLRAWGCVYIEVKPTSGNGMVHFTTSQAKRNQDNVILMIPEDEDWYIIPMRHVEIWNGTFSLGMVSEHGNAYRRKKFEQYKNAFFVIEAERGRQSRKLKELHDRT